MIYKYVKGNACILVSADDDHAICSVTFISRKGFYPLFEESTRTLIEYKRYMKWLKFREIPLEVEI